MTYIHTYPTQRLQSSVNEKNKVIYKQYNFDGRKGFYYIIINNKLIKEKKEEIIKWYWSCSKRDGDDKIQVIFMDIQQQLRCFCDKSIV